MKSDPKAYLHYTQEQLDRNYDQRGWCPAAPEHIARYTAQSEAVRRSGWYRYETHSYGSGKDEKLDLFGAQRPGASTIIYIHGGAWRNFSKDDFSFIAPQFVRREVNCAILNFSKLPEQRLPDIVGQLRRALKWIYANISKYGGDAEKLYLCGHSSGAHLSAILLSTKWVEHGLPADLFKGAALLSGSYDLEPAVISSRGSYIKLTKEEERNLSPIHFTDNLCCPVFIAYTNNDTDEFRRQSAIYATAAKKSGRLSGLMCLPDANHFSIIEELSVPKSPLLVAIFETLDGGSLHSRVTF